MLNFDNPVELPRKLGKHAFIVLWILQAAAETGHGPATAKWIQQNTPEFGPNTVTAALDKLTSPEIQMAVKVIGGWVVNKENAFQLPLGYSLLAEPERPENHSGSDSLALDVVPGDEGITPRVILDHDPEQDSPKNHSGSDSYSENPGSIINDNESLTLNKDSSSSLTRPDIPSLEIILENLNLVFGDVISKSEVPRDTTPQLALAWVCKANRDHLVNGFKNPIGLIKARLKVKERRKILHLEMLPEAYLVAIGMWRGSCSTCRLEFRSKTDLSSHVAEAHPEPDPDEEPPVEEFDLANPILDQRTNEGRNMSPNQAWQSVLGQLQMEMPRASFDTWVRDSRPVDWGAGILKVGVRNAYTRDWLESRLLSTVQRLLAGMLDCTVDVRFVLFNGGDDA